jgi:glutamyl-tRNA reductase
MKRGADRGPADRRRRLCRKTVRARELILRIGNILKRSAPPPVEALEQIAFGPYVFHLDRGELRQGEEIIHLTDRERNAIAAMSHAIVNKLLHTPSTRLKHATGRDHANALRELFALTSDED